MIVKKHSNRMTLIAFLCKVYLLLSAFNLAVSKIIYQSEQQYNMLLACSHCNCYKKNYKAVVPDLTEIYWSRLTFECWGTEAFLKFVSRKRKLHYNGSPLKYHREVWTSKALPLEIEGIINDMKLAKKEGRNYEHKEKKTFEIKHAVIHAVKFTSQEAEVGMLTTSCKHADKSKLLLV